MKYFRTWQEALTAFIKEYGDSYQDAYNLVAEFEQMIEQNVKGVWFWRS